MLTNAIAKFFQELKDHLVQHNWSPGAPDLHPVCGFVVTLHNTVQVPHWYEPEDDFNQLSWICHIPLCDCGGYLCLG